MVSKDALIAAICNGRIVSDAAVTTCINAARAAIGDSGEDQPKRLHCLTPHCEA